MLPITTLLLLQDYMEYEDFRLLSDANYINTPTTVKLIKSYCKLDDPYKLEYLIDRLDNSMRNVYCELVLKYNALRCLDMLLKKDKTYIKLIVPLTYEHDMLFIFNYLIEIDMIEYFSSLVLNRNNRVLEGLVELYSKGKLYSSSLLYELERLRRYDLIDKVVHVYY